MHESEQRPDPGEEVIDEAREPESEAAPGDPGPGSQTDRYLRRSREDRVIAGVCGGLGRYLEVDPVLFRIAFVLALFAGGIGVLIYIALWVAVPEFPSRDIEARALSDRSIDRGKTGMYLGALFVVAGLLILLHELFEWFDTGVIAALVLIAIGAVIVIRGMRRD